MHGNKFVVGVWDTIWRLVTEVGVASYNIHTQLGSSYWFVFL